MSTITDSFIINSMFCTIETTDGGVAESRATLFVECDGRVVTDASGYCSPIYSAYNRHDSWKLSTTYGAARNQMIRRILREAIVAEIEAHKDFCLQQIEQGEVDPTTGADL